MSGWFDHAARPDLSKTFFGREVSAEPGIGDPSSLILTARSVTPELVKVEPGDSVETMWMPIMTLTRGISGYPHGICGAVGLHRGA